FGLSDASTSRAISRKRLWRSASVSLGGLWSRLAFMCDFLTSFPRRLPSYLPWLSGYQLFPSLRLHIGRIAQDRQNERRKLDQLRRYCALASPLDGRDFLALITPELTRALQERSARSSARQSLNALDCGKRQSHPGERS